MGQREQQKSEQEGEEEENCKLTPVSGLYSHKTEIFLYICICIWGVFGAGTGAVADKLKNLSTCSYVKFPLDTNTDFQTYACCLSF